MSHGAAEVSPVELLEALVRTPSVSGGEEAAAAVLASWAAGAGLAVSRDEAGVRLVVEGTLPGPTLLFASHLDTVPPGEGWTVDPYGAERDGDRLYGRGAADAKGCVSAMAAAAARLQAAGGPARGRLVVLATFSEETRDTTMPEALRRLGGAVDAAVVGEPTSLAPCVAQRGQVLLRLTWHGEQLHAGWVAGRSPAPVNAVLAACSDLPRVAALPFERRHPRLGGITVTPTMVSAGVARNVTPPSCEAVLDVRTTPAYTHAEVVAAVRRCVEAEVEVLSDRLVPAETPPGSRLLEAQRRAAPGIAEVVSPTCSDWVWLRSVDAIKLGPGASRLSHTADEWVSVSDVTRAASHYAALAREYLR